MSDCDELLFSYKINGHILTLCDDAECTDTEPADFRSIIPGTVTIKEMDFRRQDKITKKQLRYLKNIHEVFASSLSTLFSNVSGETVKIYLVNFGEYYYKDLVRSLPNDEYAICIKMKPLRGYALFLIDNSLLMKILYPQFSDITIRTEYKLTNFECKKIRRLFRRVLSVLQKSWKKAANLHLNIESMNSLPQCSNIISANELCVELLFEYNIGGDDGMITFCIPYTTIEPVINKFAYRDLDYSIEIKGDTMKPSTIHETLDLTQLPIRAELGHSEISIKEIKELHSGSIIELNGSATEPIDVYVKDIKIATAKVMVISNGNFGIRIEEMMGEKKIYNE
jgi:flagellar motor switch protein FliM